MHHHLHLPGTACEHLLGRVDPRVKILTAVTLLALVITGSGFFFPLVVLFFSGTATLALGVRPRLLLRRLAEPLFIAFMVLLLKLFLAGHDPLFRVPLLVTEIVGYREGLVEGLRLACRILAAVNVVALLCFATPFSDILSSLAWLRVPRGLVEVALFAWRSLFLLLDDATVVYTAQKNRLGYCGYRRGLRSFGTLAGQLVIKAFDGSETMTTAMVQRGYDGSMPLLPHPPFRRAEVAGAVAIVATLGCLRAAFPW